MFPIILVFILRESVDRSDNPTSRRNMNSRSETVHEGKKSTHDISLFVVGEARDVVCCLSFHV